MWETLAVAYSFVVECVCKFEISHNLMKPHLLLQAEGSLSEPQNRSSHQHSFFFYPCEDILELHFRHHISSEDLSIHCVFIFSFNPGFPNRRHQTLIRSPEVSPNVTL